LCHWNFPFT